MLRGKNFEFGSARIVLVMLFLIIIASNGFATSVAEVLSRMEQIEKKQTADKEELGKQLLALKNSPKSAESPNLAPWLDSLSALKSKIEILSAQLAAVSIDTSEMPIDRLSNLENAIANLSARLASNESNGSLAYADASISTAPIENANSAVGQTAPVLTPEKKEAILVVDGGADFVSRYLWRGMEFGSAPNIQPAFFLACKGFELGFWGSYAFNSSELASEESDIYLTYTYALDSDMTMSFALTDYYYPNAGIGWGNFNNYNDKSGAGAHMVEMGFSLTGPTGLPLGISAYCNVFNDPGHNVYFQLDYPLAIGETDLNLTLGATGGSQANPNYYGTEKFAVINMGMQISKTIKLSESLSIPANISYTMNPRLEKSYITLGLSF
jgi:hypothetical protein